MTSQGTLSPLPKTPLNDAKIYLEWADLVIDGRMNCHTPEYEAMDHLRLCVHALVEEIKRINASISELNSKDA